MQLSVIVQTKNAGATLARALKSVEFADEIIVVDMQSSDNTVAIARQFTDHIFSTKDVGYVEPARNEAISKAHGEWLLILDADEVVSQSLQSKIVETISKQTDVHGYSIPRKNIFFGEWVRSAGWWPDFQPRLFRSGSVTWDSAIHSKPKVSGPTKQFPEKAEYAIEHENYQTVSDFLERLNRYTSITATQPSEGSKFSSVTLLESFRKQFLQRLFAQEGISGGYRAVLLSLLQTNYEVAVAAKSWELAGKPSDSSIPVDELRQFHSELGFWLADWKYKNSRGIAKLWWMIRRKLRV